MKKIIICFVFAFSFGFAEVPKESWKKEFSPSFDLHFTPYAGAENLMSVHRGLERLEDQFFSPVFLTKEDIEHPEQCPSLSSISKLGRRARYLLFWLPESSSLSITQHEVFGHGYRIRDLGPKYCKVKGYQMFVIGGTTKFKPTSRLTASQNLTIAIAGVEASSVLADQIRLKWLQDGRIDPRQYLVYNFSSLDLTGYCFTIHQTPKSASTSGNDMSQYLFFLNATYPNAHLSYRSLKNQSLLNLLDPFLYYAIYTASVYNANGVTATKTPMIDFGSFKYLPAVRFALTPFGPQYYLVNYFLKDLSPTCLYVKWGKHGDNTYYGVGVQNRSLFMWKEGSIGFKMDVWNQPDVLFEPGALSLDEIMDLPKGAVIPRLYPEAVLSEKHMGAAISIMGAYGIVNSPAHLSLEVGYKTRGYLPGESLLGAPILRGGVSLNF